MTSTATVFCNLIDLNDNIPYFLTKQYKESVMENVSIGTKVLSIDASDDDSGKYENKNKIIHAFKNDK